MEVKSMFGMRKDKHQFIWQLRIIVLDVLLIWWLELVSSSNKYNPKMMSHIYSKQEMPKKEHHYI